jgi:hypothetical protein
MTKLNLVNKKKADPGDIEVCRVSLRPLDCRDRGFESRCRHEYLSVVFIVCCAHTDSATERSLVQEYPTECVSLAVCDLLQQLLSELRMD